ncbi:hypothetical protein Tco_0781832 [Tanacetum coccineum]
MEYYFNPPVRFGMNTMAEHNVPAQAPTRTDEQIISVDILRNTNFFRAFSASASVPAVYIQQFWNSMKYDEKTGVYSCQVDEQWFNLKLLWEEFTQGIQTFFSHKASHKASLKDPKKKAVPLLIPYGRFTKMIIYYLGSTSDVHKRLESPCHLPGDDFLLAIQQSSYYPKYLEMVAKNTKKTPQDSASKQPEPATKRAPPKIPQHTYLLPQKVRKGKPSFQLVDEDDEAQQESVSQGEGDDLALELAKKMSLDAHQKKGEGEGADVDIERAIKLSLDPLFLPQGRAPVGGVTIRDPVSKTTPKLPKVVGKGVIKHLMIRQLALLLNLKMIHQRKWSMNLHQQLIQNEQKVKQKSRLLKAGSDPEKAHEALAGPDPEPIQEDQTGPDSGKVHVSLAGPNPEHMDDEFLATAYPKCRHQ